MNRLKSLLNINFKQHGIYWAVCALIGVCLANGQLLPAILVFFLFKRFKSQAIAMVLFSLIVAGYVLIQTPNEGQENTTSFESEFGVVVDVIKIEKEVSCYVLEVKKERYYVYDKEGTQVIPGDRLLVSGNLAKPNELTVPHAFDFKTYLSNKNIFSVLYPSEVEIEGHQFHLGQWQYELKSQVEQHYSPKVAAYLNALVFGIKDDLSDEFKGEMQSLGLSHIMAISGLHIGIFCTVLYFILKLSGVIVELIDWIIVIFLIVFIILTGAAPSVVRAGCMVILQVVNRQYKLGYLLLDIFSMVLIGNLLINPNQIMELGFVFSYVLTLVFICSQSTLKNMSPRAVFFFVPFMAQIISTPLQVYYNYILYPLAILANILVVPIMSLCLIPLLLLTLVVPYLDSLTHRILGLFELGIKVLANCFDYSIVYGAISFYVLLFLFCIVISSFYFYEHYKLKRVWGVCCLCLFLCLEVNRIFMPFGKVTMLDVGQGDSFIIQSPYKSCSLVTDTGGVVKYGQVGKSIFSKTLEPYLLGEGIRNLDFLILTHGDYDHIGEAKLLLEQFDIKHLVVGNNLQNDLMNEIITLARTKNTEVIYVERGDEMTCGALKLTFFHPNGNELNENDQSIVYELQLHGFNALFTGDISSKVETTLLRELDLPKVNVYKVAHHGSNSSNSARFIKQLEPTVALISSGENNTYGHPHATTMSVLEEYHVRAYNTAEVGSIELYIRRNKFWINNKN